MTGQKKIKVRLVEGDVWISVHELVPGGVAVGNGVGRNGADALERALMSVEEARARHANRRSQKAADAGVDLPW